MITTSKVRTEATQAQRVPSETTTAVPQKEADALFAAAKKAIQARDFSAFKKLLHPMVNEFATPAQIAQMFADLTAEDVSGWVLGAVEEGSDGPYARVLNAEPNTLAAFDYDGAKLKLMLLGTLEF